MRHHVRTIAVVAIGAPPIRLDLRDLHFDAETGELSFAVNVPEHKEEFTTETAPGLGLPDVDKLIRACVPGGTHCDPKTVADKIRGYFAQSAKIPDDETPHTILGQGDTARHLST